MESSLLIAINQKHNNGNKRGESANDSKYNFRVYVFHAYSLWLVVINDDLAYILAPYGKLNRLLSISWLCVISAVDNSLSYTRKEYIAQYALEPLERPPI
jgi:hypothetical protein